MLDKRLAYIKYSSGGLQSSRGVVLLWLALLLAVIVAFLALAVDTARYAISHSQQQSSVELAALGALQAYVNAPATGSSSDTHDIRLEQAISRAESILGSNLNILLASPNGETQITPGSQNELADATSRVRSSSAPAGTITPGVYFFAEPRGNCTSWVRDHGGINNNGCPCSADNPEDSNTDYSWNGECFRPNENADNIATSFQVRLNSKPGSLLTQTFGALTGISRIAIGSQARSAISPSNGVFLIDMSLSTTFDTHIPLAVLPASDTEMASQYVFELAGGSCPENGRQICVNDGSCSFLFEGAPSPAQSCVFYGGGSCPVGAGMLPRRAVFEAENGRQPAWRHFRDDYRCYRVDLDGAGTLPERHFLIDVSRHTLDDGTEYIGPQPLTNILRSIYQATNHVENQVLAGDTLSAMAFDQEVLYDRTLNENLSGRVIGPTFPGRDSWELLRRVVNVDDPGTLNDRINNGWFPRPDGNTDIPEAILEAQHLIDKATIGGNARNFVTLISDGFSNCWHAPYGEGSIFDFIFFDGLGDDIEDDALPQFAGAELNDNRVRLRPGLCVNPTGLPVWDDTKWLGFANPYEFHWHSLAEAATLVSGFEVRRIEADEDGEEEEDDDDDRTFSYRYAFLERAGQPTYVHQKIQFNAAIFGGQASTVLKRDPEHPGQCLTDKEARKQNKHFVPREVNERGSANDPQQFATNLQCFFRMFEPGVRENCPYYLHNDSFYRAMTKPTGGFYLPLRPPCDTTAIDTSRSSKGLEPIGVTTAQCKNDNKLVTEVLDPVCAADMIGDNNLISLYEAKVVDYRIATASDGNTYPASYNPALHKIRLTCDPQCRTQSEQLSDLVNSIYAQTPIVLVR